MTTDYQVVTKAVFGMYKGWERRGGEAPEREAKRKSACRRCCEPTGVEIGIISCSFCGLIFYLCRCTIYIILSYFSARCHWHYSVCTDGIPGQIFLTHNHRLHNVYIHLFRRNAYNAVRASLRRRLLTCRSRCRSHNCLGCKCWKICCIVAWC